MEKPRTYNADLARLPAALLPLTAQRRWVVWPWEARATKNGAAVKWTKPPRMAHDPSRNARSNDPETWGSYADAVAAVAAGNADGIGYMLKGSDIGAVDIDRCFDKDNAKLVSWAERLHDEAGGAYQEVTVDSLTVIEGTGEIPPETPRNPSMMFVDVIYRGGWWGCRKKTGGVSLCETSGRVFFCRPTSI